MKRVVISKHVHSLPDPGDPDDTLPRLVHPSLRAVASMATVPGQDSTGQAESHCGKVTSDRHREPKSLGQNLGPSTYCVILVK